MEEGVKAGTPLSVAFPTLVLKPTPGCLWNTDIKQYCRAVGIEHLFIKWCLVNGYPHLNHRLK